MTPKNVSYPLNITEKVLRIKCCGCVIVTRKLCVAHRLPDIDCRANVMASTQIGQN